MLTIWDLPTIALIQCMSTGAEARHARSEASTSSVNSSTNSRARDLAHHLRKACRSQTWAALCRSLRSSRPNLPVQVASSLATERRAPVRSKWTRLPRQLLCLLLGKRRSRPSRETRNRQADSGVGVFQYNPFDRFRQSPIALPHERASAHWSPSPQSLRILLSLLPLSGTTVSRSFLVSWCSQQSLAATWFKNTLVSAPPVVQFK